MAAIFYNKELFFTFCCCTSFSFCLLQSLYIIVGFFVTTLLAKQTQHSSAATSPPSSSFITTTTEKCFHQCTGDELLYLSIVVSKYRCILVSLRNFSSNELLSHIGSISKLRHDLFKRDELESEN